jgi:hypothetical protein
MASTTTTKADGSKTSGSDREQALQPVRRKGASMPSAVTLAGPTCLCGQALEYSLLSHCPRCGDTRHGSH